MDSTGQIGSKKKEYIVGYELGMGVFNPFLAV
jgi:hypothetical protein